MSEPKEVIKREDDTGRWCRWCNAFLPKGLVLLMDAGKAECPQCGRGAHRCAMRGCRGLLRDTWDSQHGRMVKRCLVCEHEAPSVLPGWGELFAEVGTRPDNSDPGVCISINCEVGNFQAFVGRARRFFEFFKGNKSRAESKDEFYSLSSAASARVFMPNVDYEQCLKMAGFDDNAIAAIRNEQKVFFDAEHNNDTTYDEVALVSGFMQRAPISNRRVNEYIYSVTEYTAAVHKIRALPCNTLRKAIYVAKRLGTAEFEHRVLLARRLSKRTGSYNRAVWA